MVDPITKPATPNPESPAQQAAAGSAASGVLELPLGMNTDQMKVSNPAAVQQIEEAGKKTGEAAERERVTALTTAFGSEPEFLQQCIKDGLSVTDAKAKKYDTVASSIADLQKQVAELKASTSTPQVEFAAGDKDKGTINQPAVAKTPTDQEAADIWNNPQNVSMREEYGTFEDFACVYRHETESMRKQYGKKK